ncbi:Gcd10p-domain-containing protein [Dichomitus squalens LYAD-421 SS1]|uniref:Gcd10p-domain-containing protein n=1 Tax=Dichomitus squalens (strain LYAD-421) TaxID=732165 RepID=UPI0004412476|nr:Gcd10p-domain-containing protein [Dichomitus squalens LYAD-421 SS1]EJF67268.1 Gcd10p-domain-containing protein [Dichomitus squalens LYAD-421 SS1]
MDVGEGSSQSNHALSNREETIQLGHTVLLKIPSGDIRTVKLEGNATIYLGKFGSFPTSELVGQPFGLTYEIVDKKLKVLPPRPMQEVEDTEATNELIHDGQSVQPLTLEEIESLKKSGLHASEIIKKQIEQHANYSLKTEYSKEKYKKRKEMKYSKSFSVIEPTMFNVCEYWFHKDQNRLRDIRPDALAQILNLANVRPGGRYLVVDDASGVVVSAVLDRLGGQGRLLTICDVDSPPAYPVMTQMNFRKEVTSIMSSLNWATADEDYTPILASTEPPSGKYKSDGQRTRLNKRKVASDLLMQTREELFAGEFDGLIVATEYDPYSILEKLFPYLGGSASIVVHSPYVQVVTNLQNQLRDIPGYLGPAVTEGFLRKYQVLPGRTHPMMNASGSGGFILHVIKIYDDESAVSVMQHRHRKKAKLGSEDVSARATPTGGAKEEEAQSAGASSATLTSIVDTDAGEVDKRTS